jgi:hypothetical protein
LASLSTFLENKVNYGIIFNMATLRQNTNSYNIGNTPPEVTWTVVRGDTASFKVYVTDDSKSPLNINDWNIKMEFRRENEDGTLITTIYPEADPDDLDGEFTVSLTSEQSESLETGDLFDIQLSDPTRVWTVAKGTMIIIEDVTSPWQE